MGKYSNEDFRRIVGDKKGNIVFYKEKLREYGLISEYAKLSDEHIDIFNEAREIKESQHKTWKNAFDQVLSSYGAKSKSQQVPVNLPVSSVQRNQASSIPNNTELVEVLNRIAEVLERIEQKL